MNPFSPAQIAANRARLSPEQQADIASQTAIVAAGGTAPSVSAGHVGADYHPEVTYGSNYTHQAAMPANTPYTDDMGRTWGNQVQYQTAINQARDNYGVKQGGLFSGTESAIRGAASDYGQQGTNFTNGLRQGQNTINSGMVNNALNLRRSMAGIASGLRQGIRSGGVSLANMNAMDSGAAEAMARAFARQGNQQAGDVNNQAQLAENELSTQQENLNLQRQQGLGQLTQWRENKTRDISDGLRQSLAELSAEARGAGLGDFVDTGRRDQLIAQASAELSAIDQATQAELAKIQGLDRAAINMRASEMDAMGAAASNPFSVEGGNIGMGQRPAGAPLGPITIAPRFRNEDQLAFNPFLRDEEVRV